jgi:hypothetical protein
MGMTHRYVIPQAVLDDCRAFFQERGREGCEGTGLLAGYNVAEQAQISRFIIPEQRCIKTAFGVSVELTERAHYTLTDLLRSGERFYARIHSHPRRAYHSGTDDENEVLTHRGAISIVVPFFAREPILLSHCAIYRLEHGSGWLRLSAAEVDDLFEVTDE